jgi:methylamine dehydrogenase heavy chain
MRCPSIVAAILGLTASSASIAGGPPLPNEQISVAVLGAPSPHWIYLLDEAFANEIDARVHLFDGDSYRRLGQIDAGFNPGMNLSPDGKTTVVATTYFSRGSHGSRVDVVEFTDNTTLATTHEIVLPEKRAQTLPTYFNVGYSSDGHFVYASYVTPAASFGVLDPQHDRLLGEIDTAGCVLVIPSGPNRVSSLCQDGRLMTVTLDQEGHEVGRTLSEPFFDAERDPLFVQGVPSAKGYTFFTFLGEVHEVDFSGAQPVLGTPWSIVSPSEKGDWRPGGQQIAAIHRTLGRLYVPMHRGTEGSHKVGGTEIWVFDLATHRRLARWPMKPLQLSSVVAIQVSQDAQPILFAATDSADVAVLDALTGRLRHIEKNLGQTPWQMLNP